VIPVRAADPHAEIFDGKSLGGSDGCDELLEKRARQSSEVFLWSVSVMFTTDTVTARLPCAAVTAR